MSECIAENGGDVEELLVQRQSELAKLDKMNIVTDSDPSATTQSGGSQFKPVGSIDPFGDTLEPTGEDAETYRRKQVATINGTEIDLTPTAGMKEEHRDIEIGKRRKSRWYRCSRRRATQILSGNELDPQVVEMSAWFARHEVDKKPKVLVLVRMAIRQKL